MNIDSPALAVGYLISLLIGGLIGAVKQRPLAGVIYALLLGPVGWLIVAIVPGGGKKCPRCAEVVKREAQVCKHCQANLTVGGDAEFRRWKAAQDKLRSVAAPPVEDEVAKWEREHPEQANSQS